MADGDFYWTLYYDVATGAQLAPSPYVVQTTGHAMQANDLLTWMWRRALDEWA